MKKIIFVLLQFTIVGTAIANNIISDKYMKGDFKLFHNGQAAPILFDSTDYKVVQLVVGLLADDIYKVAGSKSLVISTISNVYTDIIIVGTLGKSKYIDQLVEKKQIDTAKINGKWETYSLQVIDNPYKKVGKALVIFGSDRRGTAYGMFELSEQMGVSPWYWWADVPVQKRQTVIVKNGKYTDGTPSVKYRGIFINDEDWGMKPWSSKTFEPELGDIGPKTYTKICELLLRLKANYLWPAMHECTGAFNKYPENKVVADQFAIVMGGSHCEPLLYNNATEWKKATMGEWDYFKNREGICKILNQRVSENCAYENVYTIGIRGIHDHAMEGDYPIEKQIALVEQAIADQRDILSKNIKKDASEIPQIFVPYAEVLHLYNNGLKIPDDVTLMWVDDNYGYIRRLSDPIEAQRSGGSGVYYHIAYLGNPHEYTWLSTTNPVLIYEEMKKSYDYGADRIWMANVGDIKPAEYNTSFFLDLAWNIDTVNHSNVFNHQQQWYTNIFGAGIGLESANLMRGYYQLNFSRKPEFMGWGEEYASTNWRERIEDTHFSFSNYNEAENRLKEFEALSSKAKRLYANIPEINKAAFFQLVYYPIVGASYMNHKLLLAQKNRWYAKLGHAQTNQIAKQVSAYQDSARIITHTYEAFENGKWKEMISEIQSYGATFAYPPPIDSIIVPKLPELGIIVEENKTIYGTNAPLCLPVFSSLYKEKYSVKLFNKGTGPVTWSATLSHPFIQLSNTEGILDTEQDITVSIDWTKKTDDGINEGSITFKGVNKSFTVWVKTFNPVGLNADSLKNIYVEKNGYLSVPLEDYHRKVETSEVKWITYAGLGQTGASMAAASNKAKTVGHWVRSDDFAHLEYDIYTFNSGRFDIYTYLLPTYAMNSFLLHRMAVSVDDESPKTIYVGAPIDSEPWRNNVRRNSSIHKSSHYIAKPGKHTLKVFFADPGVVFDKIVIDFGGLKDSYLGPQKTMP